MRRMITLAFCLAALTALPVRGQDEAPKADEKAPEKYKVKFETTRGDFVVEVTRKWSPVGADHFHRLVKEGFYNECRFFRVVPGFVVQFGINGDPNMTSKWKKEIKDDPVVASNLRGYLTYAKTGRPNSRTTQLFINYRDNARLDEMGFSPFAKVTEGMEIVDKIYSGYGERPQQPYIERIGNSYLKEQFPNLDYIKKATVMKDTPKKDADKASP